MEQEQDIIEFFKPRYKVIADYPGNPYSIGHIVELYYDTEGNSVVKGQIQFYSMYPHLFKYLYWWEERKPEEMPEYVKSDEAVFKNYGKGHTPVHLKVIDKEFACDMNLMDLLPATEEEYLTQNK